MTEPSRIQPHHLRALSILLCVVFVVLLNETTMNVAIEEMTRDPVLNIDERGAAWLTTAFMLTMAVVIPTTGWLQRRLPTRSMFLLSTSAFLLGTIVAAIAPGFAILIGGRVIQAFGTAIAMPLLMTTVMTVVPPQRRGRVMGMVSMVISVAPALGPVVSGMILSVFSWRGVFGVMTPIVAAVLLIGLKWVPNITEIERPPRLDVVSLPLAAIGFGGSVYALSAAGDAPGWRTGTVLAVGLLGVTVFVLRQIHVARRGEPLLDVRILRFRRFTVPLVLMMLGMMSMFGVLILLPLLLQRSFGLAPITVGLILLPGSLLTGLLGPGVGYLYDRVGARPLLIPGAALGITAFTLLQFVNADTPWWYFLVFHLFLGTALAFVFGPTFTTALGSLPHESYGHGSAIVGTAQQVAGALGNTVVMTITSLGLAAGLASGLPTPRAMIAGAHNGFAVGLVGMVGVLILACFTRRPADQGGH